MELLDRVVGLGPNDGNGDFRPSDEDQSVGGRDSFLKPRKLGNAGPPVVSATLPQPQRK